MFKSAELQADGWTGLTMLKIDYAARMNLRLQTARLIDRPVSPMY